MDRGNDDDDDWSESTSTSSADEVNLSPISVGPGVEI